MSEQEIVQQGADLSPIYERLSSSGGYHPFVADTFADWSLQAGDVVTMVKDGKSYTAPVHVSTMTWRGAPKTTLETTGNQARESVAKLGERKSNKDGYYFGIANFKEFTDEKFEWEDYKFDTFSDWTDEKFELSDSNFSTLFEKTGIDCLPLGETLFSLHEMTDESLTTIFERQTVTEESITTLSGQQVMTAESLTTVFERQEETAQSITTLSGQQVMTAESLTTVYQRQTVTEESVTTLAGQQVMTAESLTTVFSKTGIDSLGQNQTLYGLTTQTAESLATVYTKTGINSLGQSETLFSRITQTADSITSEVTRATEAEGTLSSRITQTESMISTKVSAGDIASEINQTAQSVLISASKINLQGYVTATELDAEKARFDNLVTGITFATALAANNYSVAQNGAITFIGGNAGTSVDLTRALLNGLIKGVQIVSGSNNTYKLQYQSVSSTGWVDAGNFSRATTLTGEWDSGTYTVTASPQGNTQSTTIYIGADGNGSTDFSVNVYHTSVAAANTLITGRVYLTEDTSTKTVKARWGSASGTIYGSISTIATYNAGYSDGYDAGSSGGQGDGWDLAYGKVTAPSQGTGTSFTVQVPDETYNTAHTYTFTIQKGDTPGSSGYASVALSGTVVGRIAIGDWYDAGVTAGEAAGKDAVTINKGSWSQGIVSFTKSAGTASTKSVQLTATAASWNGNSASVQIWDGTAADSQHGVNTGYTVTVDASARYSAGETAGKNAVTITKGSWSQGIISFTKSEGTASTKSVQLCSTTPSWNGNTATVQIWDGTAADAQHGSNTGYTVTVTAPDQTVYYWEDGTQHTFPSNGYRLHDDKNIVVGTDLPNGHWVLNPEITVTRDTWSGGQTTFKARSGSTYMGSTYSLTLGYTVSWNGNDATISIKEVQGENYIDTGYTIPITAAGKTVSYATAYTHTEAGHTFMWKDSTYGYKAHGSVTVTYSDSTTATYDAYGGIIVDQAVKAVSVGRETWSGGHARFYPTYGGDTGGSGYDLYLSHSLSGSYYYAKNITINQVNGSSNESTGYNISVYCEQKQSSGDIDTFYVKIGSTTVFTLTVSVPTVTVVNNAPGYYSADGTAMVQLNGNDFIGKSFHKTVHFGS